MGLQGVFGLGTWEEGVWGRTVLLEEPQQDSAYFLRTKQSVELALGWGGGGEAQGRPTTIVFYTIYFN